MIKRPLCYAAVSLILGIVLAKIDFAWAVCGFGGTVLFSVGFIWKMKKKREKQVFLIAFVPVFVLIGSFRVVMTEKADVNWDEDVVVVTGTIYDIQKREKNTAVYVKDVGKEAWGGIIYYDGEEKLAIGNVIQVKGKASAFENGTNPGQFQAKTYYSGLGLDFSMFQAEILKNNNRQDGLKVKLYELKEILHNTLDELAGEQAGILQAMLLGEKSQIETDVKQLYQKSGISHILVISGLHFSMIGTILYEILRKMGFTFGIGAGMSVVLLFLYGIMTGFGVSAVRAFVMFAISMWAMVLGRGYDLPSALGTSVCYILIDNPLVLFQTGFLLSVGAILGVILLIPAMEQFFSIEKLTKHLREEKQQKEGFKCLLIGKGKKVILCLIQGAVSGLGIQLVTLPILLSSFYEISTYSILINCLILPISSVVMYSGLAGVLVGMFLPWLGKIVILPAIGVLKLYELICIFAEKLPGAVMVTGASVWYEILLYYMILGGFIGSIWWCKKREIHLRKRIKGLIFTGVLVISYGLFLWKDKSGMEVVMLDVGQGQAIYVRCGEMDILYDGGSTDVSKVGQYRIVPFLKSQGVDKLELVVISHMDADHYNGIQQILEEKLLPIECLMLPDIDNPDEAYVQLETLAKNQGIDVKKVVMGDVFLAENAHVTILHPKKGYRSDSKNDTSIVMKMVYKDFSMLLTGDVEEAGEENMICEGVLEDVDVLQVAHHGSDSSTTEEFLELVTPEYALISCGKDNSYGHPSKEVLRRLDKIGCLCYVTMENGCLSIDEEE